MNIAYIQCDARFNQWLLEKIQGKYVIEYTVQQAKKLKCQKIIAGIYNCNENQELKKIIQSFGGGGCRVITRRKRKYKIFKCGN